MQEKSNNLIDEKKQDIKSSFISIPYGEPIEDKMLFSSVFSVTKRESDDHDLMLIDYMTKKDNTPQTTPPKLS